MKIAFVRPHLFNRRSFGAMEPLAFAVLAARTPSNIELQLFDERIEPIPETIDADLVAITVETFTARRAYQIASNVRARGMRVILGGYHVSFAVEEALKFADGVVIGDADHLWEGIIEDARNGRLKRIYRAESQPDLAGVRYDRSIFNGKRYSPMTPIQFGRGCRFACDFCSIHAFYGNNVRVRPIPEFVREIEETGRSYFLIVDDNLFVNAQVTKDLLRALVPLKITWTCQVSLDIANDREIMDLLAESGCVGALIGFESLNSANLRQMKKGWNLRYGTYINLLEQFYSRGIMIYGSFIFGYDHDTVETFRETTNFAIEAKLALVNFSVLTPTPGAALYDQLQAQGRLIYDRWWLNSRYRYGDATFVPKRMSASELTEGAVHARRAFYASSSIVHRALSRNTHARSAKHLGLFLLANITTRRELNQKIGMPLGSPEVMDAVTDEEICRFDVL